MSKSIDHNADVAFADLTELHPHLARNSEYFHVFDEAYRATSLADNRRNQSIKYLRQALLFQCLSIVLREAIPGDFADCGCFRGQSTFMIARMMQKTARRDALHAFDSFEGLSEFTAQDNAGLNRDKQATDKIRAHFKFPVAAFSDAMKRFDFVQIHPGWIPSRFNDVSDRRFALVHIDVDLYEPTRDCLEFFYSRLSSGGFIVVDDYNANVFPGCNLAVDQFVQANKPALALPGQTGSFVIRRGAGE